MHCFGTTFKLRRNQWHNSWAKQAQDAEKYAAEAHDAGDRASERLALLRASNYRRASAFMLTGEGPTKPDPRTPRILEQAVNLFRAATALSETPVFPLTIPFEDWKMPAYLYLPAQARKVQAHKTPVLVVCLGADSMQEEAYFTQPAAAIDRGYAVMTFEGPGQGLTLYNPGRTMRHDYEKVTSAVLDFLEIYSSQHSELDLDLSHVAVLGVSLGAHYALRAATDQRFAACVAIDPVYSVWDFATGQTNKTFLAAWEAGWISDKMVDAIVGLMTKLSFNMRWNIHTGGTIYGVRTPCAILKHFQEFTLDLPQGGSLLDQVRCPVFVTGAADSLYVSVDSSAKKVFDRLQSQKPGTEKQLWVGEDPGAGGLQAKVGAMHLTNQRVFSFLDTQFNVCRD